MIVLLMKIKLNQEWRLYINLLEKLYINSNHKIISIRATFNKINNKKTKSINIASIVNLKIVNTIRIKNKKPINKVKKNKNKKKKNRKLL